MVRNIDYHSHLPPYRSLLTPNARYDYQLHSLIPLSQNELNNLHFENLKQRAPNVRMKYKSLLIDVNRKLSMKFGNSSTFTTHSIPGLYHDFQSLPIEIQYYIFNLLDFETLKTCLVLNKYYYKLLKSFIYRNLEFDSTYRFAQFITMLRLNPKLGKLVKSIDLSNLKPCNYEISDVDEDDGIDENEIKAGWRDWKFMKNPLYCNNLTRIHSHNPSNTSVLSDGTTSINTNSVTAHKKRMKFSFFKPKKKHELPSTSISHTHPMINKFLVNFSNTKDLPIGYILHLINMCPNLISINLGNLSLLTDYEISPDIIHKFHTFDIINNYPKQLLLNLNDIDDSNSIYNLNLNDIDDTLSLYSHKSLKVPTPVWKYNSLLTPPPNLSYLNETDGKLYLSDLNLKSINNLYLTKCQELDILNLIIKTHGSNNFFQYLNLSSMIWVNKDLIKQFLNVFLHSLLHQYVLRGQTKNLIIDLTNSGMYKDLAWAKIINLNTREGFQLVFDILNDELFDDFQRFINNERLRRGRIAENYN